MKKYKKYIIGITIILITIFISFHIYFYFDDVVSSFHKIGQEINKEVTQ